jgi:hypothetical protein
MGYTTNFGGSVTIEPPLNEDEISFLQDFNETRRMKRKNGPLFIDGSGNFGQNRLPDIEDFNSPHPDQPGLWCQWVPDDAGRALAWDGGEKFYNSVEWMEYIIRLLSDMEYVAAHSDEDARLAGFTCNHVVNGVINASGEEPGDVWRLLVQNNVVTRHEAKLVWE